ncbi:MAG: hypothetical protein HS128_02895 [Ideonella sp.]|nr:hypothetical protein [Ideonella sp.]
MFLVLYRNPKPDAEQWPGRRWLAAIDAVLWPALWITALAAVQNRAGIVVPVAIAFLVVLAAARLARAIWRNERYWFSTWRWGKVLAILMATGLLLMLLLT